MRPILFSYGSFVIPSWHLFYSLAALFAYFFLLLMRQRFYANLPTKDIAALYLIVYGFGYFGARSFSILFESAPSFYRDRFWQEIFKLGSMTLYGGMIASVLVGGIFVKIRKLPFLSVFDIAILAGMSGIAIGRIGCFLNGDDFGLSLAELGLGDASPWWAVVFRNHPNPIPRVPVQLIEAALVFISTAMVFASFSVFKRELGSGAPGAILLLAYSLIRFFDEFLRGDFRGAPVAGVLSPGQFVSGLFCVFSIVILWYLRRLKKLEAEG